MLVVEGAIITIDAMGCQRAIAQKIIDKKADYVFGLKGNQGSLREDVELFVTEAKGKALCADTTVSRAETVDADNGRIETRTTTVIHDADWLRKRHGWPGLNTIAMVESTCETNRGIEKDTRFYHHLSGHAGASARASLLAATLGESRTASTGSWTWSSGTMSAGSEPITPRPTSPPSNTWRIICCAGPPGKIHSASGVRSPGGTTSSSQAS